MSARTRMLLTDNVAVPIGAVVGALFAISLILLAEGENPFVQLQTMGDAAFGSSFAISSTVAKTLPRLLPALGIAIALRAGLWNIGAEGQLVVGAVAATGVMLFGPDLPRWPQLILAVLSAVAAGGLWALVPGVLRAKLGISEIISTLMLVYVAIELANYLTEGPWQAAAANFPATEVIPLADRLPVLWQGTLFNVGLILALGALAFAAIVMDRSKFGLRLRAVGGNPEASRFVGIRTTRVIIMAMVLSGAFAGLAGAIEILGTRGRLTQGFSPGFGFEAIAVALLGRLRPGGILAAALLFGFLDAGSAGLKVSATGVPPSIVQITGALAVVFMLLATGVIDGRRRRAASRAALAEPTELAVPVAPQSLDGAPSR